MNRWKKSSNDEKKKLEKCHLFSLSQESSSLSCFIFLFTAFCCVSEMIIMKKLGKNLQVFFDSTLLRKGRQGMARWAQVFSSRVENSSRNEITKFCSWNNKIVESRGWFQHAQTFLHWNEFDIVQNLLEEFREDSAVSKVVGHPLALGRSCRDKKEDAAITEMCLKMRRNLYWKFKIRNFQLQQRTSLRIACSFVWAKWWKN